MSSTIQRTKAQAMLFLLGAVVVGAALGFAGNRAFGAHDQPQDVRSSRARLADRLELTSAQRRMLDSVLDERNERMKELLAPVRPRLDSLRFAARAAIRQQLSADQQLRWDEVLIELSRDSARTTGR